MEPVSLPTVTESWTRITQWLQTEAPLTAQTLLAPEPDAAARIEESLGVVLPDDVREYLAITGGMGEPLAPVDELFIGAKALTPEEMIRLAQEMRTLDPVIDPSDLAAQSAAPAGSGAGDWLPEFLPLADEHTGDYHAIDLRPGPLHGCVIDWSGEEGAVQPPSWPSLRALLAELHDALVSGAYLGGLRPIAVDGALDWMFDDEDDFDDE